MLECFKTVYRGGEAEIVEKKSRFIGTVRPVESEEEAFAFLEEMRKKYWDATHNCFAFVAGERREWVRAADDGEPSGTAGRPMLDVLLGEDLYNTAVVVTRYFGGTLLGTGGLVRAYQDSVRENLLQGGTGSAEILRYPGKAPWSLAGDPGGLYRSGKNPVYSGTEKDPAPGI